MPSLHESSCGTSGCAFGMPASTARQTELRIQSTPFTLSQRWRPLQVPWLVLTPEPFCQVWKGLRWWQEEETCHPRTTSDCVALAQVRRATKRSLSSLIPTHVTFQGRHDSMARIQTWLLCLALISDSVHRLTLIKRAVSVVGENWASNATSNWTR
jgi:hypothetical protein